MQHMSRRLTISCGLLLLLGSAGTYAFAHHSTSGIYDDEKVLELSGTVKAWRFINPHPYLTMDIEDENGVMHEWDVSFGGAAVTHLTQRGYASNTFTVGEVIIVRGHPARAPGAYGLLLEREDPVREDGSPLF